ncbi:MAG: proline dehydrogenase family protein [Actinomycetia bacterium]|nr:proline dehydrogenase family protein [Actinomycetes bacterium]MCH9800879.1 proline dehydrogenase family protein [Actinomycetes bacterium]
MIRRAMLSVSRNEKIRELSVSMPVTRDVVQRFVAGEATADAVAATADITATGRQVTLDRLGEDVVERAGALQTRDDYLNLLEALNANGLTGDAEVSVKLSAVGQALPGDGEKIALELAREICERAHRYGTTVTLDMEDHTTIDSTLGILWELRQDFPTTGAVLQSYLYRTEGDCRDLAGEGSRVRLCKGAYKEPESVAYQSRHDVDLSFVRCMKILFAGQGYPMIASHDPRLVEIAQALAVHNDRPRGSYEHQMLFGVRPDEQQRLADEGERMRVYIPYGEDWYGYMIRRMAEKPANMSLFLKALSSKN